MFVAEIRACGHESDSHTWGGGGYSNSSDGDDRKIFLGLKILILEYFSGRKLRQVIFRMALF